MMTLGWTMVLQVGLLGAGPETYATARQATLDTGKPMVILVGAEWCPACVELKDHVLPKVRRRGLFDKVIFAAVDLDQEKDLGKQLAKGGAIPQLVLFRHTSDGWRSKRLVGVQEVAAIEEFLKKGIDAAESEKQKTAPVSAPVSAAASADASSTAATQPLPQADALSSNDKPAG